jgi:hypothetical protein
LKRILNILVLCIMGFGLQSCDSFISFLSDSAAYQKTSKEFLKSLMDKNYDKCVTYLDSTLTKKENNDTLKLKLNQIREIITQNFGTEIEFNFQKSGKKFTSIEAEKLPPYSTRVLFRVSNPREFGMVTFIFNDNSRKILSFNLAGNKWFMEEKKHKSVLFWLFGLLAIGIALFNVFAIVRIKNSNLNNKWLKYIAVILLNVPSIIYDSANGFDFKLFHFQIILGFGYSNAVWQIGVPLGGIYWFLKLKFHKKEDQEQQFDEVGLIDEPKKPEQD